MARQQEAPALRARLKPRSDTNLGAKTRLINTSGIQCTQRSPLCGVSGMISESNFLTCAVPPKNKPQTFTGPILYKSGLQEAFNVCSVGTHYRSPRASNTINHTIRSSGFASKHRPAGSRLDCAPSPPMDKSHGRLHIACTTQT